MQKVKNFSPKLALNLFIEFGPILVFVITFNLFDFIPATIALIIAVLVTFLLSVYIEGRIALFSLFASGSSILFGGATVIFSNPTYLILKDTVFWGLFGCILLMFYLNNALLLKKLFIGIFDITDRGWKIVTIRWIAFAFLLAVSNQLVLWYFTTAQWVTYKILTVCAHILFSSWQFLLARKERNTHASSLGMKL